MGFNADAILATASLPFGGTGLLALDSFGKTAKVGSFVSPLASSALL